MKSKKLHIRFLVLMLACCCTSMYGQKEIDSLLKVINYDLYKNPDKVIAQAERIIESDNITTENKIQFSILISTAYSSKRNYTKSLYYATKALRLLPKVEDDFFKARIYNRIGLQYQQLKLYDKALIYLDKGLQIATKSRQTKSFDKLLGFNYASRAFIYREQMSCDIANDYFNKALYYYKKSLDDPLINANLSVICSNKANCFTNSNQLDSAKICYTQAIRYGKIIDAKTLVAYGYKGLGEVNTLEGNYDESINQLTQALKTSTDSNDLILNQGIYQGLSDNYLAQNNSEKHHLYATKCQQTIKTINATESQSINKLLFQIKKNGETATGQIKTKTICYKIAFIILLILLLLFLFFETRTLHFKLKKLEIERKELENRNP
ncbi:tetratricopeptide repeat protein [Flavobacterium wongokense]|uniref:tetratricopeptide repeat protein n=1 Tax=Flavobacterium wongokense TaxID=2910674 RepID=UPI001F42039B|nr:tetratricopeptide repeat protein [Flavobacterium sp. WG47]MCF6133133.1 tetratricopeptide repeat protein [Flavobacterium sp. WG47]